MIKKGLDLRQSNMIKCSDINYTKQNCLVPFYKILRIKSERVFNSAPYEQVCLVLFLDNRHCVPFENVYLKVYLTIYVIMSRSHSINNRE